MERQLGYRWRLREMMAAAGMFAAKDLEAHLRDRGIDLSSVQVWRLVTQTPERLSLPVLVVLCDIFECTPADLIATEAGNQARKAVVIDKVVEMAATRPENSDRAVVDIPRRNAPHELDPVRQNEYAEHPSRPLRADAQRSRDRIVGAAIEVFGATGVGVALDDVVTAAGVGIGTLYRRFPTRDDLLTAVVAESVDRMLRRIEAARAEEATAWGAFERSLRISPESRLVTRIWRVSGRGPDEFEARNVEPISRLMTTTESLVARAQAEGTLRDDIDANDVFLLLTALSQARLDSDHHAESEWERIHALALDGLRVQARTGRPLPTRSSEG